jgi:hypothetical protein
MILWEVALLGKIQSRCDGIGSEVNGGKPSVNRALVAGNFAIARFLLNRGDLADYARANE